MEAAHRTPPNDRALTIDASLQTLDKLMNEKSRRWENGICYQILVHSAQSVEFSMSTFPEHKPPLFKNTVGKLAFAAFSAKGKMTHDLSEAIPGAPVIEESGDIANANERLKESMIEFKGYSGQLGQLAEHFAHGGMTDL